MVKLSLEHLAIILKTYYELEKNSIDAKTLDQTYELLPNKIDQASPGAKIKEIKKFVIYNFFEIEEKLGQKQTIDIIVDSNKEIKKQYEKIEKNPELFDDDKPKPKPRKKITRKPKPKPKPKKL